MKYITALPVFLVLALLDVLVLLLCVVIIGVIVIDECSGEFPFSAYFARKVWLA